MRKDLLKDNVRDGYMGFRQDIGDKTQDKKSYQPVIKAAILHCAATQFKDAGQAPFQKKAFLKK